MNNKEKTNNKETYIISLIVILIIGILSSYNVIIKKEESLIEIKQNLDNICKTNGRKYLNNYIIRKSVTSNSLKFTDRQKSITQIYKKALKDCK